MSNLRRRFYAGGYLCAFSTESLYLRCLMRIRFGLAVGLALAVTGCAHAPEKILQLDPTAGDAIVLQCTGVQTSSSYPIGTHTRQTSLYIEPNPDASQLMVTWEPRGTSANSVLPCHDLARCEVTRDGDLLKIEATYRSNHANGPTFVNFTIDVRTGEMKTGAGGLDGGWSFSGKCAPMTIESKPAKISLFPGPTDAISKQYAGQFFAAHRKIWPRIERECMKDAAQERFQTFEAVVGIDADGRAFSLFTIPNGSHLDCFRKQLLGTQYPVPFQPPAFEHFTVRIRPARL